MDTFSEYLMLCWLSNDPLELPRSTGLFKKSLLIYFIICYFLQANMTDDPVESLYEVGIQVALMLAFIAGMLILNQSLYAYIQIATALLFTANFVALFIVPVMVWLTVSEDPYSYYLCFLLISWYYAIVAYIMKNTLVINVPASLVLALFYFIVTYLGAFALGQII
jgi:hypothetical protein